MFDFSGFLTDTQSIVCATAMFAALIICCLYYGLIHFRVGQWHRKVPAGEGSGNLTKNALPPISVVLTARNDATWLKENLVYLLEQDYPDFEVVVVDYLSHDDTQFVLKLLKDYYPHLKVVPFKDVDAEHARLEGEGDLSLDYWRSVHEKLFRQWLTEAGTAFSEDTKVVLERFKTVYRPQLIPFTL